MNFYGETFIFDSTMSESYNLRIFDFNPSNPSNGDAGGDASIYEKWLYRREKPYFYGRYYQSPLEFDFTVGSYAAIDGETRNAIEAWLLGRATYLPLRIVQDDISNIVFNVIITKSSHIYVGNLAYSLTLHARCNSPWAYFTPRQKKLTFISGSANDTFDYVNSSSYSGYNKPEITFTMGSRGGNFSLYNASDISGSQIGITSTFTGLQANEKITLDCDRGVITSSASLLRLANFNNRFPRLIQGANTLTVSGSITEFTLDTTFARGVGA